MSLLKHLRIGLTCVVFLVASAALAQKVVITPDKADGVYKVGETVIWQLNCAEDCDSVRYVLKKGGLMDIQHDDVSFEDGTPQVNYTFDAPGTMLLEVSWGKGGWGNRSVGGAVANPDQIALSAEKPKDFDSFWKKKVKELKKVPANPVLEKGESGIENVDYWKISMDNINGSHIQGQLAKPSSGEKFPALLIVQWAGVYPLDKGWAVNRAKEGWLTLNIEAHDLPIDEPKEFYKEQSDGPLKNYPTIGNDSRETSYFLRMYLSCYRAAQYLTERPDWNGETLVVMGDSQGGQQTLMTAGFHPAITAAIALVPAGFDMLGPDVGRKGGWPQWYGSTDGKDPAKVHEASRYYDVANFVTNIKCPVLVGIGLLDETCPPEGILAGVNQLTTPKQVMILPTSGHQDRNGSQEPFRSARDKVWLPSLRDGKGAPVQ
ncbi:MAG: acetylxylan esterase [Imperialibacter sp.]|uniref:acetylxylan esterase n=1 Tax=Imperialibacter sp. TaxID=2038411 RepID=UPI003A851227